MSAYVAPRREVPDDILKARLTPTQEKVVKLVIANRGATFVSLARTIKMTPQMFSIHVSRSLATYRREGRREPDDAKISREVIPPNLKRCGCGLAWDDKVPGGHEGQRFRTCGRIIREQIEGLKRGT